MSAPSPASRTRSSATTASRCATTSTPATWCSAFEAFHRAPRAAAVYNLGGGRESNCSMLEAIAACERIAGRELDWTLSDEARMGDHRWWISDLSRLQARLSRTGSSQYDLETTLREIHDANVERWTAVAVKLSVVIPAHNEALVIEPTVRGLLGALEGEIADYEIVVVDDGSTDGTARRRRRASASPRVRCVRNDGPHGFGFAVRCGLEHFDGDAVVIVMADGSDDPRDLVLYYRVLEAGYDCAFGSRFMPGAVVRDYPRLKLCDQPDRQPRHPAAVPPRLQRHDERVQGLPARGHRAHPAAALAPLQPDRRAAAEGDHARLQLRDRADVVDEPRGRRVQAGAGRDGQPLPVHRALRLPRAAPQPRRLPPAAAQ